MYRKNNALQSRRLFPLRRVMTILILSFITIVSSGISGCGTEADLSECPDTSFSQTNLDTLEAQDPKFIWRVCNANEEYAMENLKINSIGEGMWELNSLASCTCSNYFASVANEGGQEFPVSQVSFSQDEEDYLFSYLESFVAKKGLTDSSSAISQIPGRYSYYFQWDNSSHVSEWIKIEREAYY